MPANSNPVPGFVEKLVTCADDALITVAVAGYPNATDEAKEPTEAEHPDLSNAEKLPLRCFSEAKLLGHFCTVVLNRLRDCESRTEEWKQIIVDYNNGKLVPELYQMRNKRYERTIRTWIEQYLQADYYMVALIHSNWNTTRKRKVSEIESQILLSMLLHPNRVKIGTAIKLLKAQARLGYFDSQSSIPALRRWSRDWMNANHAIWNQARLGSTFVAEHIIKTIHRDSSLLKVGDVWVADGHNLAFDILNPKTGKAKRMTLILVLDWASRYPVGASLAFTEDSQHILAAFRNGFLNMSKKLYKAEPPTIEEAMGMIGFYIRHIYGEMPHSGLDGRTPWEVFRASHIPPDRIIEPARLNFLMLSAERKAVRSEGIIWGKLHYWHPALIDQIGKTVIFRYDLADARWILVYDTKDNFICQAELRRAQHPFIKLATDQPIARKELNKEY